MSKFDQYRENVEKCQRMARASREPGERVMWLQMAQHWLRNIPQSYDVEPNAFATQRESRTGQPSFGVEHEGRLASACRCPV